MPVTILRLSLFVALACFVCARNTTQLAQEPAMTLALTHANVIDGLGALPLRDATVIIRNGRIESITPGAITIPAGATVLDLGGRWLLPGLIDAHTHIADLAAARAALASGITTARNMGVSHFVDLGMRKLQQAGRTDLPEMLAAGYYIHPQPAEGLFLDFPQLGDLLSGLSGAASLRRVTQAQLERGVQFIKINATDRAGQPHQTRANSFSAKPKCAPLSKKRGAPMFSSPPTRMATKAQRQPCAQACAPPNTALT